MKLRYILDWIMGRHKDKAEIARLKDLLDRKDRIYRTNLGETREEYRAEIEILIDRNGVLEEKLENMLDKPHQESPGMGTFVELLKTKNRQANEEIDRLEVKIGKYQTQEGISKQREVEFEEGYRLLAQSLNDGSVYFDGIQVANPDLVVSGGGEVLDVASHIEKYLGREDLVGLNIGQVVEGGLDSVLKLSAYQEHGHEFESWSLKDSDGELVRADPKSIGGVYLSDDAYRKISPYGLKSPALMYSIELKKQSLRSKVKEKVVDLARKVTRKGEDDTLPETSS